MEFLSCEEPIDLDGNVTALELQGYGCVKVGFDYVEHAGTSIVNRSQIGCTSMTLHTIEKFPPRFLHLHELREIGQLFNICRKDSQRLDDEASSSACHNQCVSKPT